MENKSGLRPLGRAVLIQPYEPEFHSSIIAIPDSVSSMSTMLEQRAIVVEVGPEAWKEEMNPRAKPGDKVFVTKLAGFMAKGILDSQQYRFVNDRDIFASITEELENGT